MNDCAGNDVLTSERHLKARRAICKTIAAGSVLSAAPLAALAEALGQPSIPLAPTGQSAAGLWYRTPATQWVEALPVGNGRLGAMVWGGIAHERLQLNEDTLFAGGPYDAVSPQALQALPEVRRLIFSGDYGQAQALADQTMMSRPLTQMPYQPLGDVVLDYDHVDNVFEYRRDLDLQRAVATTSFRADDVRHVREVFVSPVDQCVVVRMVVDTPGKLALRVATTSPLSTTASIAEGGVLLRGHNQSRQGIEGRLSFALRIVPVVVGGALLLEEGMLRIEGADEVLLLMTAATSYVNYQDVSGDPVATTLRQQQHLQGLSYAGLLQRHIAEHRRLFDQVDIDLGRTEPSLAALPTDERIKRFSSQDDPELAALYHRFGRYLLICSSRPGTQPANLQGLWNDLIDPHWQSKWTLNINTQMNYWPSQANGLDGCVEPLEAMIFELAKTGEHTARTMYGAPGWVVHNNTDLWRQAGPVDGAKWSLWPTGGAWLLQHLWDRWEYGCDRQYLRRIYPLFKGAAEFFVATLQRDPGTGAMVTSPSLSPENEHMPGVALCAGPSMDAQLLRDLFAQCMAMMQILGVDATLGHTLAQLSAQLPPHRIGGAGQLQEWQQDWDMQVPEIKHRHVSHLYALYPSSQINLRDTPALAQAARRSLEIRGDQATGWGIGWRLNLWARLGDGERCLDVLRRLLSPERTYPNLFDAHPPFQIDGNFGGAAGITEMLLQSWGGSIFLLPALPKAWHSGSVRGLRVRGAASLEMQWKQGRLARALLRSDRGGRYELVHGDATLALVLEAGQGAEVVHAGAALELVRVFRVA